MSHIARRAFLGGLVLGLGRTALAAQDPSSRRLAAEHLRATLDGMALAVIVVPEGYDARIRLESAWDRFLLSARPEELLDLGLVRRTAATLADLEHITIGTTSSLPQDAALVLLEAGSAPDVLRTSELPPGMQGNHPRGSDTDERLSQALATFLHPNLAAVTRRRTRFETVLAGEPERLREEVTRNLAVAWRLREEAESTRGHRRKALMAQAGRVLADQLQVGPKSRLRGRTPQCPPRRPACTGGPCGTGSFSSVGRRFVKFWVEG